MLVNCCSGHLYDAFNIAWVINEMITFAYILVAGLSHVARRDKFKVVITAMALCIDTVGLLAGWIVSFFQGQLGTQLIYSFFLVGQCLGAPLDELPS